ncbi:hypothetical protein [Sulfurovum sp.]|uniref:hypothetical protein n=1 Tax=Sulfurovum sp. TaxID=1969726 RepID=UPI002867F808|nr:hypothetical protein [Sulfurovum sp.]
MTAPLNMRKIEIQNNAAVLQNMKQSIWDAIDEGNTQKVDTIMGQILDHQVSVQYLYSLCSYADSIQEEQVCTYFKQILLTTNNM